MPCTGELLDDTRARGGGAVLFAAAIMLVGGAVLFFVFTVSPVHTDPAAGPSTTAAQAERYSGAVEETMRTWAEEVLGG